MVADGRIPAEGFTTVRSGSTEQLLRYISDEAHIVDYFKDYVDTKVSQGCRERGMFICLYAEVSIYREMLSIYLSIEIYYLSISIYREMLSIYRDISMY